MNPTDDGNDLRKKRVRISRAQVGAFFTVLNSIFHFIGRHIKGFWGALGTFVTLSLIVGLGAVALFALVAEAVREGMTQPFDEAVLRYAAAQRTPTLDAIMLEVTALGAGSVLILMTLTVSAFMWLTNHKWSVYLLYMGIFGGLLMNGVLKQIFQRERPGIVALAEPVHTLSFPSGHAMSSIIAYGCMAYLIARLEPSARLRRFTWFIAGLLILLIGVSRVYLGVHYPSDVIAGFVGGLAWLALVASSLAAVQFFARRRPETHLEEHDLDAEQTRTS